MGFWGSEGWVGGVTFWGDATGDLFDGSGWGGVCVGGGEAECDFCFGG